MESYELMIGNYVYNLDKIYKMDSQDIYLTDNDSSIACRFEPIPLTEQWLLDFGFKICSLSDFGLEYGINDFSIYFDNDDCKFYSDLNEFNILCVHQLQNLYFSLTQKPLTKE